jgi:hypothetical protein
VERSGDEAFKKENKTTLTQRPKAAKTQRVAKSEVCVSNLFLSVCLRGFALEALFFF